MLPSLCDRQLSLQEQACSTCMSFRFFAAFMLLRETERLWQNWLNTMTAFPSLPRDVSCTCLHQGKERGLKLAKQSLFAFRAVQRLREEILLLRFQSFQCQRVWALRAQAALRQVTTWVDGFWFLIGIFVAFVRGSVLALPMAFVR